MRIPEGIRVDSQALRTALGPQAAADLANILRSIHAALVPVLHHGLELGQNLGEAVSGVTDVVADAQSSLTHNLGRPAKYLWLTPEIPSAAFNNCFFYWEPGDYTAWTDTTVYFRASKSAVVYRGFVI